MRITYGKAEIGTSGRPHTRSNKPSERKKAETFHFERDANDDFLLSFVAKKKEPKRVEQRRIEFNFISYASRMQIYEGASHTQIFGDGRTLLFYRDDKPRV